MISFRAGWCLRCRWDSSRLLVELYHAAGKDTLVAEVKDPGLPTVSYGLLKFSSSRPVQFAGLYKLDLTTLDTNTAQRPRRKGLAPFLLV